jgi:hypothetical protein
MRQHGHALGRTIVPQPAPQIDAVRGGDFAGRLGHGNPGNVDVPKRRADDLYSQRGRGPPSDESFEPGQLLVFGVQARRRTVVLDAQLQLATVTVRKADDGFDQIPVGQACTVTLEFHGK